MSGNGDIDLNDDDLNFMNDDEFLNFLNYDGHGFDTSEEDCSDDEIDDEYDHDAAWYLTNNNNVGPTIDTEVEETNDNESETFFR